MVHLCFGWSWTEARMPRVKASIMAMALSATEPPCVPAALHSTTSLSFRPSTSRK